MKRLTLVNFDKDLSFIYFILELVSVLQRPAHRCTSHQPGGSNLVTRTREGNGTVRAGRSKAARRGKCREKFTWYPGIPSLHRPHGRPASRVSSCGRTKSPRGGSEYDTLGKILSHRVIFEVWPYIQDLT